jgi:GntR family transcriptional regulator / MocR family aminotransferase
MMNLAAPLTSVSLVPGNAWGGQMQFVLELPAGTKQPVYKQVCDALRSAIRSGRLRAGERLPSSRELALSAKVSRFTVMRSYELLTAQGYIETVGGSGTFVTMKNLNSLEPTMEFNAQPESDVALPIIDSSLSAFGKRVFEGDSIESSDAELFRELNYGAPSAEHLPLRQWRDVLNKCARTHEQKLLEYSSDPMGYERLRESISSYLGRSRALRCSANRVALFSGAQPALDLICRLMLDPGDSVVVEEPGAPCARRIFQTHGANVISCPVDENGIVVEGLYKLDTKIKLIYVTPSHQDPLGVVTSIERRMELLKWAKETGAFIIEDDFDSEFHYGDRAVPSLQGLDQFDCIIYLSSFWKVLFPVVRVAFLVLPKRLIDPVYRSKSYIERDFPLLEQIALSEFLNEGTLERQIKRTKTIYSKRRAALLLALTRRLRGQVTIFGASAGMHMIIRFKPELLSDYILACAQIAQLPMVGTDRHYSEEPPTNEFMIGFAHHSEEMLTAIVERFADLLLTP